MPTIFVVVLVSGLAAQLPAPVGSDEVRVASADYTLVIAPDGRVLCQGRNQYGACGADLATAYVETLSPVPGVPRGRAVAVVDDGWASMVLGEDGRVYVWGKNDNGLFGGTDRGPTYVRPQPTVLAGLERVIGIAAFVYGGAALRDDGTVWMWGEDREGLLATGALTKSWENGRKEFTPRRVPGLDAVTQIAGGHNHMLALKSDGTVWVWGANKYSQLGLGDTDPRASPTKIPSLAGVTRVHAGGAMSAARQADGSWVVWGAAPSIVAPTREQAQGLTNDVITVRTPSPLPGLLRDAIDVAPGVAALRDGSVRTWGSNSFGTLGTGGGVDAIAPRAVLVKSLSGIVRVWTGLSRVLALKSDGTLYVWGVAGTADGRVLRVPTVMTTFVPTTPRKP